MKRRRLSLPIRLLLAACLVLAAASLCAHIYHESVWGWGMTILFGSIQARLVWREYLAPKRWQREEQERSRRMAWRKEKTL
jgi:hypothetical protein